MKSHRCLHSPTQDHSKKPRSRSQASVFLRRWFLANSLVAGFLALCWLLLRSGGKPSRLVYPCQQAAMSAATLAFGAPVVGAVIAARRRLAAELRRPAGAALAATALILTAGVWSYLGRADAYRGPVLDPPPDYRATVFHVSQCPRDPIGERFVGLDNLLLLMGREGLKFYNSSAESLVSGPDGIIAADDVVVIKINYQWPERGGTNTDLLRGLIRRLADHPDTFTGEIVVCENTQVIPIDGLDRDENNAQNHSQSPHDVVAEFADQGLVVSHYSWTAIRTVSVDEYDAGDSADGYVVCPYDSGYHGRVSYPKFQTDHGTHISLKYGIWSASAGTYDRERLKLINVPVLKSHHATYGATACVKNYMGVVTDVLDTNSHSAIEFGILGALLGEIQPADLNILDCIWINANPADGPRCSYSAATRRDELVASLDPVAADVWAVKNILVPAFVDNGYSPPWPYPSADPDLPSSVFRTYLDNSKNQILAAGFEATSNLDRIDLVTWNGAGDADGDSDVDLEDYQVFSGCQAGPDVELPPGCENLDFNRDGDVDLADYAGVQTAFTGSYEFPGMIYFRLFVDAEAEGKADGTSWDSAYVDLQDALDAATPLFVTEVWVAEGTYTPDRGTGDREATFQIPNGVSVYGGFAGHEESLDQRDILDHPTILSGDLNGDDEPGFMNNDDNSRHVVTVLADTGGGAVHMDGCVVVGGNADGSSMAGCGGGVFNYDGDLRLRYCVISGNYAALVGGGIRNSGGELRLTSCIVSGNSAGFAGGGVVQMGGGGITLLNCSVTDNLSDAGGGLYFDVGQVSVTNSIFWGNSDDAGSGETGQIDGIASPDVNYSCIQGLTGALGGVGNMGAYPMFKADGFHLIMRSPCRNAGDPEFEPFDNEMDIDGRPRVLEGRVDMGADEVVLELFPPQDDALAGGR